MHVIKFCMKTEDVSIRPDKNFPWFCHMVLRITWRLSYWNNFFLNIAKTTYEKTLGGKKQMITVKNAKGFFLSIQGHLSGYGIEEQLPTVAVVTHYDAFGIAPVSLIWAASWQNQQNGMCAQRRLRSAWSESLLSAWWKLGPLATHWVHSKDWSDWADAQADLSLRWAHMPFGWFGHEAAHLVL